jgi:predicted RNA-binding protein YlqC (UPF0109 family)
MDEDTLIRTIAESLVEHPDKVEVRLKETSGSVIVRLHVAQEDMGRVIGKQGRIANAMRTLLRVVANKDKRVILEID